MKGIDPFIYFVGIIIVLLLVLQNIFHLREMSSNGLILYSIALIKVVTPPCVFIKYY